MIDSDYLVFPPEFEFGFSSSCTQTEGAPTQDGKGLSNWDVFSRLPGAIVDGSTPDRAIDHYNRFRSDFDLLRQIGPDTFRPSIAWSRVEPDGDGVWNTKALDHYTEMVDALLERGIKPWVTLYHWDMPQAVQEQGGWEARETAWKFRDFALAMQERFGDRVSRWTTFEEPTCVALFGYGSGKHAPGIADPGSALRAAHHVLLAHGAAVRDMHEARPGTEVGIAPVFTPFEAATPSAADRDAARRVDLVQTRFFLEPILQGAHSAEAMGLIHRYTDGAHLHEGDAEVIASPIDFLGVNYYFREYVTSTPGNLNPRTGNIGCEDVTTVKSGRPQSRAGWEIEHDGLFEVLLRAHHMAPGIPLYVTEAGISTWDAVDDDGAVRDTERIEYLKGQFAMASRALRTGVDVRGLCVWTFMDNWEWWAGWSQRFGMVYTDRDTLERRFKDSAYWYRDLIAQHRT